MDVGDASSRSSSTIGPARPPLTPESHRQQRLEWLSDAADIVRVSAGVETAGHSVAPVLGGLGRSYGGRSTGAPRARPVPRRRTVSSTSGEEPVARSIKNQRSVFGRFYLGLSSDCVEVRVAVCQTEVGSSLLSSNATFQSSNVGGVVGDPTLLDWKVALLESSELRGKVPSVRWVDILRENAEVSTVNGCDEDSDAVVVTDFLFGRWGGFDFARFEYRVMLLAVPDVEGDWAKAYARCSTTGVTGDDEIEHAELSVAAPRAGLDRCLQFLTELWTAHPRDRVWWLRFLELVAENVERGPSRGRERPEPRRTRRQTDEPAVHVSGADAAPRNIVDEITQISNNPIVQMDVNYSGVVVDAEFWGWIRADPELEKLALGSQVGCHPVFRLLYRRGSPSTKQDCRRSEQVKNR